MGTAVFEYTPPSHKHGTHRSLFDKDNTQGPLVRFLNPYELCSKFLQVLLGDSIGDYYRVY